MTAAEHAALSAKLRAEAIARKAAARKRERELAKLTSIADKVVVTDYAKEEISVEVFGATLSGYVNCVNAALEKMGFRPVRITRNILNAQSKAWCIDINTPAYLDPGCESYHSM